MFAFFIKNLQNFVFFPSKIKGKNIRKNFYLVFLLKIFFFFMKNNKISYLGK
jgi:hypothetical protein